MLLITELEKMQAGSNTPQSSLQQNHDNLAFLVLSEKCTGSDVDLGPVDPILE